MAGSLRCEIKAIIPKKWESDHITKEIQAELLKIAEDIRQDMEETVRTWDASDKPTFKAPRITRKGLDVHIEISTDSELWAMLNSGTRAHPISARSGGQLAYRPWYMPKTHPGQLRSTPSRSGGQTRFAKQVQHPGVKARNWVQAIQVKYTFLIQKRLMGALEEGMGRGMPPYIDKVKYSRRSAIRVPGE